jgi:hypothetical protein
LSVVENILKAQDTLGNMEVLYPHAADAGSIFPALEMQCQDAYRTTIFTLEENPDPVKNKRLRIVHKFRLMQHTDHSGCLAMRLVVMTRSLKRL